MRCHNNKLLVIRKLLIIILLVIQLLLVCVSSKFIYYISRSVESILLKVWVSQPNRMVVNHGEAGTKGASALHQFVRRPRPDLDSPKKTVRILIKLSQKIHQRLFRSSICIENEKQSCFLFTQILYGLVGNDPAITDR